jgi:ketol-acid reductoisomerase
LFSKDIIIIGYGAQAKAWALNLKDSGRDITIGLRKDSSSKTLARDLGFKTLTLIEDSISDFQNIILLTPDDQHVSILESVATQLRDDQNIFYAHGFSVTYEKLNEVYSKLNHILLAPKAIASEVRFNYETKAPLAAASSDEFILSEQAKLALQNLANDLGINVGPLKVSFKDETYGDLFSEQSILCSLIPYGAKASFDKLKEKGINEEMAYIECWHEVKLIADAMLKFGPAEFFKLISPNALMGGEKARQLIFDAKLLKVYDDLYADIESGKFFHDTKVFDFQRLKSNVIKEWEEHPLQQLYNKLGTKLRP